MVSPERIYRGSTRAFSLIFVLLGAAILATTLARGGGVLSLGVVMGFAFLAVGIARGWLGGGGPPWRRAPKASEHMGEGRRDRTRGQSSAGNGTRGQSSAPDRTRGQSSAGNGTRGQSLP